MTRLRLCSFGRKYQSDVMSFSVYRVRRYMMSVCLIVDVDFDHLVKVSAKFFHFKVTITPPPL